MFHGWRAVVCMACLAGVAGFSFATRAGEAKTLIGEIADSQCALNVHSLSRSHKEMMGMKPDLKTDADCARYCVKERGGRFVLQTKSGEVYKLDAQALAEQWLGMRVKVAGTLDPKTNLITVESISPQAGSSGGAAKPN
jgi:hypothetical protein